MNDVSPFEMLGFRMGKLAQLQERMALGRMRTRDLGARHCGILMVARAQPALSQQAVGELLGIDRTTMVRLALELEEQGLVRRARRADDRRTLQLIVTAAGRALVRSLRAPFAAAEEELLGVLEPEERRALERALGKLFVHWVLGGARDRG